MPGWKVLVVDDDPDIRRIAVLALGRVGGLEAKGVTCAEEALAAIAGERPDLVLLDVSMPGADGPSVLASIRALPAGRDIPVVFFTAASSEAETARLRSLGAVAVISKPFEMVDFTRRVQALASEGAAPRGAGSP